MTFFHFTSERHWPFIDAEGAIAPVESNISPMIPDAGPRVVWLLDVGVIPEFDPVTMTAPLVHGLYPAKMAVRIEVDVPAIKWTDWSFTPRMPNDWRDTFVKAGGGQSLAEHWYIWPGPIYRKRWVEVIRTASEEVLG